MDDEGAAGDVSGHVVSGLDKTYAALLDTARTSGAPPMAELAPGAMRRRVGLATRCARPDRSCAK